MVHRLDRAWAKLPAIGTRILDRVTPHDATNEVRRRARTIAVFVGLLSLSALVCAPYDASNGNWVMAIGELVAAAAACALLLGHRRGWVRFTGHAITGVMLVCLVAGAADKGGLIATELTWQCAAIIFAVLVVGARGAAAWTLAASITTIGYASIFDPSKVSLASAAVTEPLGYAFEMVILYWAVWGLAFGFDRIRAEFVTKLERRNEEMVRVLEHATDGLLTIDRDGRIAGERSARATEWLGSDATGDLLWHRLAKDDLILAAMFALGWEALLEDLLPREVLLAQIPRRVSLDGRTLDVSFTLIEARGVITGALVALHDVTDLLAREEAETARREVIAIYDQIRKDPGAVIDLVREMDRLTENILTSRETHVVLRDVHTIKGSAGLFGLTSIATLCHSVEETAQHGGTPLRKDLQRVVARWSEISAELAEWTSDLESHRNVLVNRKELDAIRADVAKRVSHARLAAALEELDLTPATGLLARLAHQGKALAGRLGKDIDLVVTPSTVRVDPDRAGPIFAALSHAVRNAVDHGIEAHGRIRLSAMADARTLTINIADDGRGIDWQAVREKARRQGLSSTSEVDLLFHDGFSTRSEASLVSGRGVGLAALREEVERAGGSVQITSRRGAGTTVSVVIPRASVGAQRPILQRLSA